MSVEALKDTEGEGSWETEGEGVLLLGQTDESDCAEEGGEERHEGASLPGPGLE